MLINFNNVIEKIKSKLEKDNNRTILDKEIALALAMSAPHFSRARAGLTSPLNKLIDYALKNKININWLLYDQIPESLEEETNTYINIKYFKNIRGSAGGGAFSDEDEEVEYIQIPSEVLLPLSHKSEHIKAINSIGDSMEPLISENAIILIDTQNKEAHENKIYLVSTNDGLFIKKIQIDAEGMRLISENKNYSDIHIVDENIDILGEVVASVNQ